EMTWTSGSFTATRHGTGQIDVTPPAGVTLAETALPATVRTPEPAATFNKNEPLGALAAGGQVRYGFDTGGFEFDARWVASATSYVTFHGRANLSGSSNVPFHVTSLDWQESDRLLAAILT